MGQWAGGDGRAGGATSAKLPGCWVQALCCTPVPPGISSSSLAPATAARGQTPQDFNCNAAGQYNSLPYDLR